MLSADPQVRHVVSFFDLFLNLQNSRYSKPGYSENLSGFHVRLAHLSSSAQFAGVWEGRVSRLQCSKGLLNTFRYPFLSRSSYKSLT